MNTIYEKAVIRYRAGLKRKGSVVLFEGGSILELQTMVDELCLPRIFKLNASQKLKSCYFDHSKCQVVDTGACSLRHQVEEIYTPILRSCF